MSLSERMRLRPQLMPQTPTPPATVPAPSAAALLVARSSFGPRDEEITAAERVGAAGWLQYQLAPESIDRSELEAAIASAAPTTTWTLAAIIADAQAQMNQQRAVNELRAATLARQLFSGAQLYERMVDFWHDHFSTDHLDGPLRYFKTALDRDVRAHAMGRFPDLLVAVAKSPAMLYYLDNYLNVASGPNENYARELLELHTLGVEGGYTEDDVKNVARVFTGWTYAGPQQGLADIQFVFVAGRHDRGEKTVLGTRYGPGGVEEGERLLAALAMHPSCARLLATKLVRRFVSDAPPASLVDRVAAEYLRTGGEVRALLRLIFESAEFAGSADRKFRRPMEYVVAATRATTGALRGNAYVRSLLTTMNELGQLYFSWPAPNGYPDVAGYWTHASGLLTRWNFALDLARGEIPGVPVDALALAGSATTPETLVDALARRVLHRALPDADRAALIAYAADGGAASAVLATATRRARAQEVLGALIASPLFQSC